ncbi:MAG: hypothetical protein JWM84_1326, partial [Nocardioides sp.]|nr:hypothetical protein [Nocardioides sp.]
GDDTIYRHNLLAASDLARSVLDEDPARRLATWASQCGAAQFVNMDIADSTGSWTTPSYLSAWYEAVDIRAVTRP